MDVNKNNAVSISAVGLAINAGQRVGLFGDEKAQRIVDKPSESGAELSALARQLSAAAERAAARDSQLSRKELGDLAERIWEKIAGGSYFFSKSFHDDFVPNTSDPELLERARQATAFLNGKGENPFKQMTGDQLSLIAYDEGGDFTVNERKAAWGEFNKRECEWTQYISQKMAGERQRTGRNDQGLYEILNHYRSLPPIEEAQIQGNYEANIMMQLSMQEVEWPEFNTSLVDLLANEWKSPADSDPAQADGLENDPSTGNGDEGKSP